MLARLRIHPDRVPDALLWLIVLGSSVGIGAVHPPVAAAVAVAAILFATWVWLGDEARPGRPPLLALAMALAGTWALLQTVPLGGLVDWLSPQVAQLWTGAGLETHLSANLAATRLMAFKCLAGAVFLTGGVHYLRRPERAVYVADLIVVVSCVVAAVGFVQGALRADRVLFLYEPSMGPVREGLRGPFVNPDHFAAVMAVGTLVALSRSLALDLNRRRFLYDVAAVGLVAALGLSLSVSGLVGLAAGLIALIGLWWRHQSRPADALAVIVPVLALGGALFFGGLLLGAVADPWPTLQAEWVQVRALPHVWGAALALLLKAPLAGLGSGSLTDVLGPSLAPPSISVWFARNQPVQSLVDFGLPVGGLLIAGLATCLWPLLRSWSAERLDAVLPFLVGLVGLAAVSLFDFALEIPAIGVLAALLAAGVLALARRREADADGGVAATARSRPRRRGWLVPVAGVVALGAVVWGVWTNRRFEDAAAGLAAMTQSAPASAASAEPSLDEAARRVLGYRPGWGRVYTAVGQAYLARGLPERAVPWLESAAQRLPNDAVTLRNLGLAYLRSGNGAAGTQWLRRSAADAAGLEEALRLMLSETDDLEVWLSLASDEASQRRLAQELLAQGRAVDALRFGLVLLDADPDSRAGLAAAAEAALRLDLPEQAAAHAWHLLAAVPFDPLGESLMARLETSGGHPGAAIERLDAALQRHPEEPALWFALGEALTGTMVANPEGNPEVEARMRDVRDHLRPIALGDPLLAADFHRLSARYYRASASWRAAASAAQLGLDAGGPSAELYEILGLARAQLGDAAGASSALRTALQLDPGRSAARQAMEAMSPDGSGASSDRPSNIGFSDPPQDDTPTPATQEGVE